MTDTSPDTLESHDLTPDLSFALEALVRVVERQSRAEGRDFRASVLLLSDDGRRLLDAAGPSLPAEYRRSIHGLTIGASAGSCGTAAHLGERVVVADIAHDPLWSDFSHLALPHGLAACWSEPIRASTGEVLGTFAMYYQEPRSPTAAELEIIETAAARAAAMLEQARAGADPRELVATLE